MLDEPQADSSSSFSILLPDTAPGGSGVRQAGHFLDQKLKYSLPAKNPDQLSLFDRLDPDMAGEVKKYEVKYEGIRLTPAEDRLVVALCFLLKKKSEHKDAKSEKFYKGNHETTEVISFGEERVKLAHIRIVPAELYQAYLGNKDYSGNDVININKILDSLAEKRFLMTYDRVRTVQDGKKTENRTDRIEVVQRLIEIVRATWDLTKKEAAQLDSGDDRIRETKGELIIALHPLFTDQIDSKYVLYPQNINRRMIIAAGGDHRSVTQAANTLRDWLLRELSSKHYECQLNADKIPYILKLDNYVQQGRKKLLWKTINGAIQICKNLNLVTEAVLSKGAEGQDKLIFKLNKDFE